jgi:hypothetical protein
LGEGNLEAGRLVRRAGHKPGKTECVPRNIRLLEVIRRKLI